MYIYIYNYIHIYTLHHIMNFVISPMSRWWSPSTPVWFLLRSYLATHCAMGTGEVIYNLAQQ